MDRNRQYLEERMSVARSNVLKELKGALEDALRYERSEQVKLRTTELPPDANRPARSRSEKFGNS